MVRVCGHTLYKVLCPCMRCACAISTGNHGTTGTRRHLGPRLWVGEGDVFHTGLVRAWVRVTVTCSRLASHLPCGGIIKYDKLNEAQTLRCLLVYRSRSRKIPCTQHRLSLPNRYWPCSDLMCCIARGSAASCAASSRKWKPRTARPLASQTNPSPNMTYSWRV